MRILAMIVLATLIATAQQGAAGGQIWRRPGFEGKQYLLVAIGSADHDPEYIALSLP